MAVAEPNKELTTSNVIRLLRKTEFRFSKNWRGVARELGVSLEKRSQQDSRLQLHSNIEAETDFLEEAIDDWIRNSDDPSWTQLISVISQFDKKTARELRIYIGIPHELSNLLKSMTIEEPQQIGITCKVFNADTNNLIESSKAPVTRDITIRRRVQEFSSQTVRVGTSIRLEITTDSNCYLYILNIGTSGKTTLLLPNEYETNNYFNAWQSYNLPGEDCGFEIDGPSGKETIQVLAFSSRQPVLDKLVCAASVQEMTLYRDIVMKRKAQAVEQKGYAFVQFDVQK
ncbi:PREDICTED: uncharacterized protein LOC105313384 isoform X2 [Amphimedon queenslandica]|uniref:DUF4384 domain-containing protein n=1 Tax=Amphimedon queenslandica TaxID=400682 RepID=A0AAN0JB00_AMPQE|nr:PREDICTED: uncharacterized protein LOC105313384 isoform X2 [Amphimedon queenslandica]|eukprot:XP_019854164.1 PREDICTED: uncharacterized protein LOC105313384 isoform X2 [Amphimedon queenslandica]